ncbi:MAG: alanine racemase [Kiritimatiellaceae bacterium]|nr:alanine racemase [Kiritimatiellaceae bacterium]
MNHSWIEIDLGRLKQNVRALRSAIPAETAVILVVKADAYGHGLVPTAKAAAEEGINWFAVAFLDEALKIRAALPDVNILVLGLVMPEHVSELLEKRIFPVITCLEHGLALAGAARARGMALPVHLKVDTGMGRLGVQWDEAGAVVNALDEAGGLEWAGVCSHFARVDPDQPDHASAQAAKFHDVLNVLPSTVFKHLSSSRAALYFPDWDLNGVRQGIVLYGYGANDPKGRFQTRPILQWKARVVQVKKVPADFAVGYYGTYRTEYPTQIATLAVGYADGYNRALSNKGDVLIGGRRCAVVGRVSMNWITADVGLDARVKTGDEAVLIGEQGEESIWADELSKICRTIPYEILTSIHASLERKYI